MKLLRHSSIIVFFTIFFLSGWSEAQSQPSTAGAKGGYTDLGIKTGVFLPSQIPGVRETLSFWGIKFGHSVSQTLSLEYDLDIANAKGINYYLAYFSLRHEFTVGGVLPLFTLLGVDGHYYKRVDSYGEITGNRTEYDYKLATGWHIGVGTETLVYGDILLRADFRMGFSPGRQLSVAIGGIYRF